MEFDGSSTNEVRSDVIDSRSLRTCPKCEAKIAPGTTECTSCGVLLPRILAQIEDPLQAEYRLLLGPEFTDRWQKVLADYENEVVHWEFISECQQVGALEFAAYRYRRIYDVSRDDIASTMLKQVAALAMLEVDSKTEEKKVRAQKTEIAFSRVLVSLVCLVCGFAIFLGRGGEPFWMVSLLGTVFLGAFILLRVLFKYKDDLRWPEKEEIIEFIDVATGGNPRS